MIYKRKIKNNITLRSSTIVKINDKISQIIFIQIKNIKQLCIIVIITMIKKATLNINRIEYFSTIVLKLNLT